MMGYILPILLLVRDYSFMKVYRPMKVDSLHKYVALHESLVKEKSALEGRLAQINQALRGSVAAPARVAAEAPVAAEAAAAKPARRGRKPSPGRRRGRGGRGRSATGKSLKLMALDVIRSKPLTRQEILDAVKKDGYVFSSTNPLNSLSAMLYSNKKVFKVRDGKFSAV